jgi:hypothetical protein
LSVARDALMDAPLSLEEMLKVVRRVIKAAMGTMVVVLVFSALFVGCAWEIAMLASQPTRVRGIRRSACTHTFEALGALPARIEFGEAVLMTREGHIALRRQFSTQARRLIWLYQIEVTQEGNKVRLDAQETLPPLVMLLTLAGALALLWTVPVFAVISICVLCAIVAFNRRTQPSEIESAFAFLEEQIREAREVHS